MSQQGTEPSIKHKLKQAEQDRQARKKEKKSTCDAASQNKQNETTSRLLHTAPARAQAMTNDFHKTWNGKLRQEKTQREARKKQKENNSPSYGSSLLSFFNGVPKAEMGKSDRKTFFGLLVADAVITGILGALYGIAKNGSELNLINGMHEHLKDYSEFLKLSTAIIPPTIFFIALIILFTGVRAERKHIAEQGGYKGHGHDNDMLMTQNSQTL
jgi:hypothetical protein